VPFDRQIVYEGGVPGAQSVQFTEGDNQTDILITATRNVNGIQLWSGSISSFVSSGGAPVDDKISDSSGTTYLSVENGPNNSAVLAMSLHGIVVPAGLALELIAGNSGVTHKVAGTVIYSLL
jgi:hypothetical protein